MTNDLLQRDGTKIEWADFTFNPWIGCAKVSEGCKHCYAETLMDTRYKKAKWGVNGTRVKTSAKNWKDPIKWNKEAEKLGVRYRVFCASLADVFEDREALKAWRAELFELIRITPHLDWMLLTKRPENIERLMYDVASSTYVGNLTELIIDWFGGARIPPHNVWLGATVENQEQANIRIPELLKVPAKVRFLSCEPLLGPIEFSDVTQRADYIAQLGKPALSGIDWIICGGESGTRARPMHPDWARSLRDQCEAAGVKFFFKQWGEWMPDEPNWWHGNAWIRKVGRTKAGALLDGREWREVPGEIASCLAMTEGGK